MGHGWNESKTISMSSGAEKGMINAQRVNPPAFPPKDVLWNLYGILWTMHNLSNADIHRNLTIKG